MRRRLALAALPVLALAACQTPQTPPSPSMNVFFTADSALLDDNAKAVIAQAATRAKQSPGIIKVRGYAANDTGSAAFNRSLAETRARAVADQLVADGIPASRIGIEPRGAVAFSEMPTEARRVEIAFN